MEKIIRAGSYDKWENNKLVIACNFNMNCNFNCSYCINKSYRARFKNHLSKQGLYNLVSSLPDIPRDRYSFAIAGGEPILYPYLPDLFKYIDNFIPPEKTIIYCATNGFLLNKFEPIIKANQNLNLTISISMHLEQLSTDKYLERFSKFSFPDKCRIKIMLEPKKLGEVEHILNVAKSYGYSDFIIQPLTVNGNIHPEYTDEEREFFTNNPYEAPVRIFHEFYSENNELSTRVFSKDDFVLNPELVNFKGMYCLAGHSSIRVLADGSVTPCYYHKGDPSFNLNTQKLTEYPYIHHGVECPSTLCACHSFTAIPKWDINHIDKLPSYFKIKE